MADVPTSHDTRSAADDVHEERLFFKFKGWVWSQRARDTSNWSWAYGYDIERNQKRKWVCRRCVSQNRRPFASYDADGLQNAKDHLFQVHNITAPSGEKPGRAEKRSSNSPFPHQQPTLIERLKLDPEQPVEQAMANQLIKSFDK